MTPPSDPVCALDAEALYQGLRSHLAAQLPPPSADTPPPYWVGVVSGGAWLAQRLARELGGECGLISSALHRDDYAQRGLAHGLSTKLPKAVDGADIWLIDDVLYTGRTVRAVLNELFDYGRPRRVRLAVLVDRGGRELPIAADFAAGHIALPAASVLALSQTAQGDFTLRLHTPDA